MYTSVQTGSLCSFVCSFYEILILIKISLLLIKVISINFLHFHIVTNYTYIFQRHKQYKFL